MWLCIGGVAVFCMLTAKLVWLTDAVALSFYMRVWYFRLFHFCDLKHCSMLVKILGLGLYSAVYSLTRCKALRPTLKICQPNAGQVQEKTVDTHSCPLDSHPHWVCFLPQEWYCLIHTWIIFKRVHIRCIFLGLWKQKLWWKLRQERELSWPHKGETHMVGRNTNECPGGTMEWLWLRGGM